MKLNNITAMPHASGNQLVLSWENPDPGGFPGVRVVRRERTHPTSPQPGSPREGVVVADTNPTSPEHRPVLQTQEGSYRVIDTNLQGETVYYYTLFPYPAGDPPVYAIDERNRTAAMATSPSNLAGRMYDLLPGINYRYDTVLPKATAPVIDEDRQKGQLRRFLDLPGEQLDQLHSATTALLDLYNVDRVDGRLLPLLAEWIGWKTDHRLEFATQRNHIRDALSIYKTIGVIPSVEATVKRILGWESRVKEFVHNVSRSNQPERFNIWARSRNAAGEWSTPAEPLSLAFSHEGRPSSVYDANGTLWVFFHTFRNNQWDIWFKTLEAWTIDPAFQGALNAGIISKDLEQAFALEGYTLSRLAKVEKHETTWLVKDREHHQTYELFVDAGQLHVYRWAPSQRLTHGDHIHKHPTAVLRNGMLWVMWDTYNEQTHTWQIHYQTYQDGAWSAVTALAHDGIQRKRPSAVVDHLDHIWLFWLEETAGAWELKYQREEAGAWVVGNAHTFPLDAGAHPRVEADVFVFFQPPETTADAIPRLWVFWARRVSAGEPSQSRWEIAYRVAINIDPNQFIWLRSWSLAFPDHFTVNTLTDPVEVSPLTWYVNRPPDWSPIFTVPKTSPDHDDREPAAHINADGAMELYWSSTRDQSWSIWSGIVVGDAPPHLITITPVTAPPYSQRDPRPLTIAGRTWMLYHANTHLQYASEIYAATETMDFRYSGSTTVDTRNLNKINLHGTYQDFQTYTYDTGVNGTPSDLTWYARNAIGIYLTPDTEDLSLITQSRNTIKQILREFLPIHTHAVFIIEPTSFQEQIYTVDFPTILPPRLLTDTVVDGPTSEIIPGLEDVVVEV
ncbi:MAG: phage tail protein, partial [Nitrospirota bacterium]|nr:phage tail protein [Nitrospirota bacterium]